eukprot:1282769-Pyramimonas_sp.AAC.1
MQRPVSHRSAVYKCAYNSLPWLSRGVDYGSQSSIAVGGEKTSFDWQLFLFGLRCLGAGTATCAAERRRP